MQLPGSFAEEPEEAGGAWTYLRTLQVLSRSLLLTLPMPEPWSLEPRTLAEAKCRPDWPLCKVSSCWGCDLGCGYGVSCRCYSDAAIAEWT